MVGLSARALGNATATVGMAWVSVHSFSLLPDSSRARMPVITTSTNTTPASTPKMPSFRRDTGELCSVGMRHLRGGNFRALLLVYHTEDYGNKHQGRDRCQDEAADHGATERRILLAALTQPQRHRGHTDDHGERRHQ